MGKEDFEKHVLVKTEQEYFKIMKEDRNNRIDPNIVFYYLLGFSEGLINDKCDFNNYNPTDNFIGKRKKMLYEFAHAIEKHNNEIYFK